MQKKDVTYKAGIWQMKSAESHIFDKDKLLLNIIDKVKSDIENNDPKDKKAQELVNNLLYHYCWKLNHDDAEIH